MGPRHKHHERCTPRSTKDVLAAANSSRWMPDRGKHSSIQVHPDHRVTTDPRTASSLPGGARGACFWAAHGRNRSAFRGAAVWRSGKDRGAAVWRRDPIPDDSGCGVMK